MYQTLHFGDFVDAFNSYDRKENFSYDGLKALFDYYEEYEESTGEKIELDVIAICCEWNEYESEKALLDEHSMDAIEEVENSTTVIKLDNGGYLIQVF